MFALFTCYVSQLLIQNLAQKSYVKLRVPNIQLKNFTGHFDKFCPFSPRCREDLTITEEQQSANGEKAPNDAVSVRRLS